MDFPGHMLPMYQNHTIRITWLSKRDFYVVCPSASKAAVEQEPGLVESAHWRRPPYCVWVKSYVYRIERGKSSGTEIYHTGSKR